ncbi:hypothetical protein INT47_006445 [Mucor saturninus]|uniref:Uncharacterized protein n=1 Tax=Mucor saturninus TaxID=64648 RepID=A0A8H7UUP3_9FUNG|nr:hypothetical protein INT47_006445 [Mucor saturninus]
MSESVELGLPSTPEPSRRYVQWKEDDVGLLLTDLEQVGHYAKWKENKSGYSKRVAEQVFKNVMYHEAIKFKVRWLESRFKLWQHQLTLQDEATLREKLDKEFPYYDRCKPIFTALTVVDSPVQVNPPALTTDEEALMEEDMKREPSDSSAIKATGSPLSEMVVNNPIPYTAKKRKSNPAEKSSGSECIIYGTQGMTKDKVKIMELELELKKMDHQERMQEMKLEQLRLEIELQRLKRDTPP